MTTDEKKNLEGQLGQISQGPGIMTYGTRILAEIHKAREECKAQMDELSPGHPDHDDYHLMYEMFGVQEALLQRKLEGYLKVSQNTTPNRARIEAVGRQVREFDAITTDLTKRIDAEMSQRTAYIVLRTLPMASIDAEIRKMRKED